MLKIISVTLFLSQIVLAQTNNSVFIKKAVGNFDAVKGSPENCKYGPYTVEFHSKKEAVLGKACGAVLWMASPSDPMGVFFCNVDSKLEKKTIGLNIFTEENEKPDFYVSSSGKISATAVQITVPAEGNNPEIFANPETLSSKTILAVTSLGIDVEDTVTLKNGQIKTRKCQYHRVLK